MKLKILCDEKIVGETSLVKQGDNYSVIGELFEHPRLQCEKTFKSKLKATWNMFWLKRELQSIYKN